MGKETSGFVADIQREAYVGNARPAGGQSLSLTDAATDEPDSLDRAMEAMLPRVVLASTDSEDVTETAAEPLIPPGTAIENETLLLLSGGGQWGAYGAGLFEGLHARADGQPALPNVTLITGISTGALQTLLLMVALDPKQSAAIRTEALARLSRGYSPAYESEVVNRNHELGAALLGSMAGTDPLHRRIRTALCTNVGADQPDEGCKFIRHIANSTVNGFIGLVEADTGDFRYVDVKSMAGAGTAGDDFDGTADCLAAAAMASSAMPVFHQQLRVVDSARARKTYFDGGVRRSVFLVRALERLDGKVRDTIAGLAAARDRRLEAAGRSPMPVTLAEYAEAYRLISPTIHVVRNGPTVRDLAAQTNRNSAAGVNGKRGYDLLVNESEIGAIAALRLVNPHGKVLLTTADGYARFPGPENTCKAHKDKNAMFDPDFMACLRRLGAHNAQRPGGPWWEMRGMDLALPAAGPGSGADPE